MKDPLSEARRCGKLNHYCRDVVHGFSIVRFSDETITWIPRDQPVTRNGERVQNWKLIEVWTYDIEQREWKHLK